MPMKCREYEVKLDLFEGPLDLLLYLVNKAEVNIIDIKVSEVAEQYLEYLDLMRELNIEIAAEYLHMAATLIRLKAAELLPEEEGEAAADEEGGIYNREQLIAQLLEYKKFKEAAGTLRSFESEHFGAFGRGRPEMIEAGSAPQEISLGNINVFDLLSAFKRILDRADQSEKPYSLVGPNEVKIDECIEKVLSILCDRDEVPFEDLFAGDNRKIVIIVTFMAVLELVKMQEISFRQEKIFGPIFVVRCQARSKGKSGIDEKINGGSREKAAGTAKGGEKIWT